MDTIINLSIKTGANIEELHLDNTQSIVKQLLNERAFEYVTAYHSTEHHLKIELNKILKQKLCPIPGSSAPRNGSEPALAQNQEGYLIQGTIRNLQNPSEAIPVVIKISFDTRVEYETKICRKLRNMKCPLLWFSSSFYFWDTPILVYEMLSPLSRDDDPCQVGQAILEQLRYLHQFGVHNNIKSENIGVRITKEQKREYILFNYEGTATEKLEWGYRRNTWQRNYSSQTPKERDQVTTAKNDLLELGYCLNKIAITPQQHHCIDRYIKMVYHIDQRHIPLDIYDRLIAILTGKSRVSQCLRDISAEEETSSSDSPNETSESACSSMSSSNCEEALTSDGKSHSCFLS